MRPRLTQEQFLGRVKALHPTYDFSQAIYHTSIDQVAFRCDNPSHGLSYQTAEALMKGGRCVKCVREEMSKKSAKGQDTFIAEMTALYPDYDFSKTVYVNARTKISFNCANPDHGVHTVLPQNLKTFGCSWCKTGRTKPVKTLKAEVTPRKITKVEAPQTTPVPKEIQIQPRIVSAPVMKKEVEIAPVVTPSYTFQEHLQTLIDYINSLGVSTEYNPETNTILCQEENVSVILYNLSDYVSQRGCKDLKVLRVPKNLTGRLIQIFEDEWLFRREAVENRLRSLLGKGERIYARQTEVVELEPYEVRGFCKKYHTQGAGQSPEFKYGLVKNNNLYAVMSFAEKRYGTPEPGVYEMMRFCTSGSVVGGFSKLLKKFVEEVKPKSIISYCDLRFGDGTVYESNGFRFIGDTEPGYTWSKAGVRYAREKFQKHKLEKLLPEFFLKDKTEREICTEAGFFRVFDAGNSRWALDCGDAPTKNLDTPELMY